MEINPKISVNKFLQIYGKEFQKYYNDINLGSLFEKYKKQISYWIAGEPKCQYKWEESYTLQFRAFKGNILDIIIKNPKENIISLIFPNETGIDTLDLPTLELLKNSNQIKVNLPDIEVNNLSCMKPVLKKKYTLPGISKYWNLYIYTTFEDNSNCKNNSISGDQYLIDQLLKQMVEEEDRNKKMILMKLCQYIINGKTLESLKDLIGYLTLQFNSDFLEKKNINQLMQYLNNLLNLLEIKCEI